MIDYCLNLTGGTYYTKSIYALKFYEQSNGGIKVLINHCDGSREITLSSKRGLSREAVYGFVLSNDPLGLFEYTGQQVRYDIIEQIIDIHNKLNESVNNRNGDVL